MQAREVMSHPVITLRPHLPARVAAARLVARGFVAAPVVDAEGRVHGIVTEAELLRGHRVTPDDGDGDDLLVRDVMRSVTGLPPDTELADLAAYLLDAGAGSVPIIECGHVVGMVSRRDVLRVVAGRALAAEQAQATRRATP